ncbi:class I SAM-dependent methyltransferase [Acinetobacter rudis]|uniref:Class I SAM-dependent methyltransferase n=1 Tax=Acinetobacter rudis TaxID=632955 RepID=A0AAW8J5N6_9GAMM|nr:class I SAM-dependent methyltransferase [Acinetobacter rudis]MDQ8934500.1 class I SAM-dependent methyltransferase [Acinetobacter rudis]MDQ8951806.1 class I SAM-dependent methyltransferase [Acinetobacter rudis]MDQ9016600.1 class I SAM-dependent methyltransferase [Acinetobacter rudis]
MPSIDLITHNNQAWDQQAKQNSPWSQPVSSELIASARKGDWRIHLTPTPLPQKWLGNIQEKHILCLASAGGQQAPILAAAGAHVTVFDLSAEQLAKDEMVAKRDGLHLKLEQGDMQDLSRFANASFDLIIHPISNQYVPDIETVWKECHRVLKINGTLLASFFNPAIFIADRNPCYAEQGLIKPRYKLPYADLYDLPADELKQKFEQQQAMIFGHSLLNQIQGQLQTGLVLVDYFEEIQPTPRFEIEKYLPSFIATRSQKLV